MRARRELLPELKWFLGLAGLEIDPWAVDLDIFHARIYARRAAGVQQLVRELSAWVNSGFRACADHRKNSQDDAVTMPVCGWRRALPRFGVSLVNAHVRDKRTNYNILT